MFTFLQKPKPKLNHNQTKPNQKTTTTTLKTQEKPKLNELKKFEDGDDCSKRATWLGKMDKEGT